MAAMPGFCMPGCIHLCHYRSILMKISPTFLSGCLLAISLTGTLPRLAHADNATASNPPAVAGAKLPLPFLLAVGSAPSALPPPPMGHAHAPGAMRGPFGEEPVPPILRGIKLTEAQQDQVFAILHELAPRLREQGKIIRHGNEALRALVLEARFDEAKARLLAQSDAKARAEFDLLLARSDSQLLAVLTPQQRQQLDAWRERSGRDGCAEHDGSRDGHAGRPGGELRSNERG